VGHAGTDRGRCGDLRDGAGERDGAYRHQVLDREMQPDPEHQQDHADFGELGREARVGDEARREGTDRDARDQVSDDRRYLEQVSPQAEQQCKHEADGEEGDERSFV
jgi:hypothetical protein